MLENDHVNGDEPGIAAPVTDPVTETSNTAAPGPETAAPVPSPVRKPVSWAIDYRDGLLEEMGHAAAAAGGYDAAGVLLGSLLRRTIFIDSWRPFPRGVDRHKLQDFLAEQGDPAPPASGPIGWVVSRPDGGPRPRETDLQVFGENFRQPWHVLLVIRPEPAGAVRVAFFVRDADGSLNVHRPYREFLVHRKQRAAAAAGVLVAAAPAAAGAVMDAPVTERAPTVSGSVAAPPGPSRAFENAARPPRSPLRWIWLALPALAIAIAVAVFGFWLRPADVDPPLEVTLTDKDSQLLIRWSAPADLARNADFGALKVVDGSAQNTIRLTSSDVRRGSLTWARQTGDVRVDLNVWSHGERRTGVAQFFGPAPALPAPGSDALNNENDKLRTQLAAAQQRARSAENLVRILKDRLQMQDAAGNVPPR